MAPETSRVSTLQVGPPQTCLVLNCEPRFPLTEHPYRPKVRYVNRVLRYKTYHKHLGEGVRAPSRLAAEQHLFLHHHRP